MQQHHKNNRSDVLIIPVTGSDRPVQIDRESYELVLAAGHTGTWYLGDNGSGYGYVLVADNSLVGNNVRVARLIAGVGKGQRVSYYDGNRLNLCSWNLKTSKGYAKGRTRIKPTKTSTTTNEKSEGAAE